MMLMKNELLRIRLRSVSLVAIMLLSLLSVASFTNASVSRTYATNRDPVGIALGDFDCDNDNDVAVATEGTHTISIHWNDGTGDLSKRTDLWVSGETDRVAAQWDDFANVVNIEVGEFDGNPGDDIVIYQRNNPFKTASDGTPAGEPGNITFLNNNGCSDDGFTIGQRYSHFWVWDIAADDLDGDGNDEVVVIDLMADLSSQRMVTYQGPISGSTQAKITSLGPSTTARYTEVMLGDWGETQGIGQTCMDKDAWTVRLRGADYTTGQYTGQGHDDNVTVVEYNCLTNTFPTDIATATPHTIQMGVPWGGSSIADIDGDGVIDVVAITDGNIENMSYKTSSTSGTWGNSQIAYFGPYIAWSSFVTDLNGDQEPDFINPTIAEQINSTDSTGQTEENYYLPPPSTAQVTLSDGNGGHLNPLSYQMGRRPSAVAVGQMAGGSSSSLDIVVGQTGYDFGNWIDNMGWDGQYDTISVIEMDNSDLAVSGIEVSPTDRYYGIVGEGTRDINVTITNTGMDVLNGNADINAQLKEIDESASTNNSVYSNDFDGNEDTTGCSGGCGWTFDEYRGETNFWHLETNHSTNIGTGNNAPEFTANHLKQDNFMWAGTTRENASGSETWSGYHRNWDMSMTLNDVDLSNSDRAWMSAEIFNHLSFDALGQSTANGFQVGDIWDDLAIIDVKGERGWSTIACPTSAILDGACASGKSMWGGYDNERLYKMYQYNGGGGSAESALYYGLATSGTFYGWQNFTEDEGDSGAFDLSTWAGETVDIRFRFRTGFGGSISDENETRWSGRDGFAVDNVSIWKQTTAFMPNPQVISKSITLNNLAPGETHVESMQANFVNDTIYRINATVGFNQDTQAVNNELVFYLQTLNVYDPAVVEFTEFEPGALFPEAEMDIDVKLAHYGNTVVDFDVKATVLSAEPNWINCDTPATQCSEDFDGDSSGSRYTDDGNGQGTSVDDTGAQEVLFGSNAYWFGHPTNTVTDGYDEVWNESFTIPDIDLTSMTGDFVSLTFDYFAETFFRINSNGDYYSVNDYAAIQMEWEKDGNTYNGLMVGMWNDYDQDGTCNEDGNGDGFIDDNETSNFSFTEINYIGDSSSEAGTDGNYNVFFNTDGLVRSRSIDLTHLYIQNKTGPSSEWGPECMSLANSMVDLKFSFGSDDDSHNGRNDGLRGVAFDNITIKEFTFTEDAVYSQAITGLDAEETQVLTIGTHDFEQGVYMVEVESIFDNTSSSEMWHMANELSIANNIQRVIFSVESVDITVGKPNTLACLIDTTYNCVMPMDSANSHQFKHSATNGVLAGDYNFFMEIVDISSGQELKASVAANNGQSIPLQPHDRTNVSYTPWNDWEDGHTYNVSFRAELSNGNPSGNVRYFHATMKENIDVAILSDATELGRLEKVKEDLDGMGMTYTQFSMKDWDDYLTSSWLTHYDKVLLPWQSTTEAATYYERFGSMEKLTLENFMAAGGTVQMHLGPYNNYYSSQNGRLPFAVNVINKDTGGNEVTFSQMDIADPYHPLLENVKSNNFQSFGGQSQTIATAIINTNTVSATSVPLVCGGRMETGGQFQSIIQHTDDPTASLLAVCSYQQGGLIATTMDVELRSGGWDDVSMPLLANLLSYQVSPYPSNFGAVSNGIDITINGEVPSIDPSTGQYGYHYMKSNSQLEFGYTADGVSAVIDADWEIDGPTNPWANSESDEGPISYTSEESPSASFCKSISTGGCAQGTTWILTMYLHDDEGHARIASLTVMTDDNRADEYRPEANATIIKDQATNDNINFRKTKQVQGKDWDVYEVQLAETGDLTVSFNASESFDLDATDGGNGILTYEWTVYFDYPYGSSPVLDGHLFTIPAAASSEFSYRFQNLTADSTGTQENSIRMELVVYDNANKNSDRFRMFFIVVPEGFGDEAPTVDWTGQKNNTQIIDDWVYIGGNITSGAERGGVRVDIAFDKDVFGFDGSVRDKHKTNNTYNSSLRLCDPDSLEDYGPDSNRLSTEQCSGTEFNLGLKIGDYYTNKSESVEIQIRIRDKNNEWVIYNYITINLKPCKGDKLPDAAVLERAEWIWNPLTKECEAPEGWEVIVGADGTKTVQKVSDDTSSKQDGGFLEDNLMIVAGGGVGLVIIVLLSLMVLGKRDDGDGDFSAAAGGHQMAAAMDPMEAYVQQLIAQGYPEETARAYAAQYAGHFQQQGGL